MQRGSERQPHSRPERRRFLEAALRGTAVLGIGLGSAWLARRSSQAGASCSETPCGRCGALAGCRLPKAQAYRAAGPQSRGNPAEPS